jgi:lipoprotein
MKRPPYQKVLKNLIIIISVMIVGSCVMFWVDGGLGALTVIFCAVLCSIVLSFLFLFYYSFFYRWARQWLLTGILVGFFLFLLLVLYNKLENLYSVMMTPKNYDKYLSLHTHTPYRKNGKTLSLLSPNPNKNLEYDFLFLNEHAQLVLMQNVHYPHFYKFNRQGILIDSLQLTKQCDFEYAFLGSYYVNFNDNQSLSWAIDGDTILKPITIVNDSPQWTDKQRQTFFNEVQNTSDYYYIYEIRSQESDQSNELNTSKFKEKVFFYRNKQWQYFYLSPNEYTYQKITENERSKGENNPLIGDFSARFTKETTCKHHSIHPLYVTENNRGLYIDLVAKGVVFHLLISRNNPMFGSIDYQPLYCLKNGDEHLETYQDLMFYSNTQLLYQLFYNSQEVYIIRELAN